MIAEDIMSPNPICVGLDMPLREVKVLMEGKNIRHVLIQENNKLMGVLSERDLLRNISPYLYTNVYTTRDLASLRQVVHQVMTRQPKTVFGSDPIRLVLDTMVKERLGCLPVINVDRNPIGIITRTDIIRRVAQICAKHPGNEFLRV